MCLFRSAAVRDSFPEGEVTNLLSNYFVGYNEGMIGREAEMRCSMAKCEERQLEGQRGMWNFCEAAHEQWYHENCRTDVRRYEVHAILDYWIMSQDCRSTFPWHESLKWWVGKLRPCYGKRRWSMQKSEPIARLHVRRSHMVKHRRMYSKQNWKWMLARLWKNENIRS